MKSWQLQQAKAHLSRVVQEALLHGPQEISLRGEPAVIIISKKEYSKLVRPKSSFVQMMSRSPWKKIKIRLIRDRSLPRETEL